MDRILKLIYTNFGSSGRLRCPIPNGSTKSWVKTLLRLTEERGEEIVLGQFRYMPEAESYQKPMSDNIFRHHNFFGYFVKNHNMYESCVTEEEAEQEIANGTTTDYLYVIETEWSNLRFLAEGVDVQDSEGNVYRHTLKDFITPRLVNLVKTGKVKIVLTNIVDPSEPFDYYEKVDLQFEELGIPSENIIWLNGNAPITSFKEDRPSKSKFLSSILSLPQAAENYIRYPTTTGLGYLSDIVRPEDLDITKKRPKRFICFNRMVNRPHRLAIAYIALKYNLLEDSIFSFVSLPYPENIVYDCREYWEGDDWDSYSKKIFNLIPYEIDTQHLSTEEKQSFSTVDNNRKDLYADSYFHIVSETRLGNEPSVFMSEKTWRPILNLQPFLYIGNYKALETLRNLGFKTFGSIIDESYDDILDPVARFTKIKFEILRLKSMSMDQIHDLYYSVKDILIHNQQLLPTFLNYDPLQELYK